MSFKGEIELADLKKLFILLYIHVMSSSHLPVSKFQLKKLTSKVFNYIILNSQSMGVLKKSRIRGSKRYYAMMSQVFRDIYRFKTSWGDEN